MDTKLKLILLLLLFAINPVSAKFICGEVTPTDQLSPSWYEAKTSLTENQIHSSTCKVSPSNNRYCCDIDIIKDTTGYQWKISDIFEVEITDTTSGYFTLPKNLTLTGAGYDVAPKLTLEKAIQITSPNTTLTISPTLPNLSIQFSQHCTESGQIINNTKTNISLQTLFGKNEVSLYATCNSQEFQTNHTFFIIKNITLKKEYTGFKIRKNKIRIKSEGYGTVNLQGKLSSPVSNIELKEYVPIGFEILTTSNNATIQTANSLYNVITWKISDDNFNLTYLIKAPEVSLGMHEYKFTTQIDQTTLQEETVYTYKLIPIILSSSPSSRGYTPAQEKLSKVSLTEPLILENEEEGLTTALYSTTPKEEAILELYEFNYTGRYNRSLKYIKSYKIKTNLNSTERGIIKFKYEITRSELEEKGYKSIQFFTQDNGFRKIQIERTESDNVIKYNLESDEPIKEIFIFAEKIKPTFMDKILIFLNRIGLYDY